MWWSIFSLPSNQTLKVTMHHMRFIYPNCNLRNGQQIHWWIFNRYIDICSTKMINNSVESFTDSLELLSSHANMHARTGGQCRRQSPSKWPCSETVYGGWGEGIWAENSGSLNCENRTRWFWTNMASRRALAAGFGQTWQARALAAVINSRRCCSKAKLASGVLALVIREMQQLGPCGTAWHDMA